MAYGTEDEDDFFSQIRFEYSLMAEYAQLQRHSIPGVYVLPSGQTSHMWYGLIFITSGIYQGAVYKFTLTVSKGYPDDGCPEFDFQAGVFHPVIHYETGELDVRREFPTWRHGVDFLHHLLTYAQGIFHNIETTDPLNMEAAKLYDNNRDEFQARVKQSIERCRQEVLNPNADDPHSIKFAEWNADVIKAASTMIFEPESGKIIEEEEQVNAQVSGLSWVKKGTMQPFRIPCQYSVWGEYVVVPSQHRTELVAVSEPLMVTGINPTLCRSKEDQQKEAKGKYKIITMKVTKKKCYKSTIESVKAETKRKGVDCTPSIIPLMTNQPRTRCNEDESSKLKTTQAVSPRPSNTSYHGQKAENRTAYKRRQCFQPCGTCKRIMEHRRKVFVEFKSTIPEDDGMDESESVTQAAIDQPCDTEENVATVTNLSVTMNSGHNQRSKSLDKSDLVKSKERIEKILSKRKKELYSFMDEEDHIDFGTSPIHQGSGNFKSMLISLPHVFESLAISTADYANSEAIQQHKDFLRIKKRRGGLTDSDLLIPIPNQGNFMRILKKSPPDKEGFVSWHEMACIKLRGYQVEIIRAFIHHLGISYWRLRYLVPKAASTLSHTNWVQINSLYFNVMITPHHRAINMSNFNSVTSAKITGNKGIVLSKDPDMLMEELLPIPNAFSPTPMESSKPS